MGINDIVYQINQAVHLPDNNELIKNLRKELLTEFNNVTLIALPPFLIHIQKTFYLGIYHTFVKRSGGFFKINYSFDSAVSAANESG